MWVKLRLNKEKRKNNCLNYMETTAQSWIFIAVFIIMKLFELFLQSFKLIKTSRCCCGEVVMREESILAKKENIPKVYNNEQ